MLHQFDLILKVSKIESANQINHSSFTKSIDFTQRYISVN